MRKCFYAMIAFSFLCGCTIGQDYLRPPVTTPATWTISYEAAAGLADSSWWQAFGDPVLDELVTTALRNNLDLQVAAARVDQLLGRWRTTRAEAFPQIGASATVSRQDDTDTGLSGSGGPYSLYQGSLSVSWELDLWGSIRRSTEAAQAEVIGSEAGRRGVLLTVVSNVVGSYLVLRGLDRQLEIAWETERAYAESLRIFRMRHDHGTVSQLEVSQVESEYESARQTIPQLEEQISRQEHLIAVLLGQNPEKIPRGKSIDQLTIPGIPAGLPSRLLAQRPDLIEAEQNLVAANARVGVAEALYYPNVSLTGLLGVTTIHSDKLFDGDSSTWAAGGDLLAPIYTFGAIEGQVMSAEAARQQALYRYRQAIISAFAEVEDALVSTTKGRETREASGRKVSALALYASLARKQYDAGTADYLQVLDANRSLFSGQLDYVQIQTEVLTSLVNVYRAMGGGWLDAADRETAWDSKVSNNNG